MQVPFLFLTSKKRCQYIFHGDRTIFSCGDRQQCLPRQRGGCRRVLLQTSGKCIGVAKAPKHETSCCLLLPVCSRAPLQVEACLRRSLLIDFITELPERFGEGGLKFFSLQNDKCCLLVHLQFWCIHMKHAVLGHGRAFNPWLVRLARSTRSKRRRQKLAPLATKCHRLLGPHASVIHMSVLTVRCGVSSPRVSPEFRFWVVLASTWKAPACASPFVRDLAVCVAVGRHLNCSLRAPAAADVLCISIGGSSSIGDSGMEIVRGVSVQECFVLLVRAQSPRLHVVAGHLRDQLHHLQGARLLAAVPLLASSSRVAIVICVDIFRWRGDVSEMHVLRCRNVRGRVFVAVLDQGSQRAQISVVSTSLVEVERLSRLSQKQVWQSNFSCKFGVFQCIMLYLLVEVIRRGCVRVSRFGVQNTL